MPVSSTAILASGMRSLFAASAAALKIASTCSWEYEEYALCAALTRSSIRSNASIPSSAAGAATGSIAFSAISNLSFAYGPKTLSGQVRHIIALFISVCQ